MLTMNLMNAIYNLMTSLLSWVDIPDGSTVISILSEHLDNIFDYGLNIFCFFFYKDTLKTCFYILLILVSVKYIYMFVMFVIHKIPLLNIR